MNVLSVDHEFTRVQKTRIVSEMPISYATLDVCNQAETVENCSRCPKCIRTLMTLDIIGAFERYASVFDTAPYLRKRGLYLARLYYRPNRYLTAIQEDIAVSGFKLPVSARFYRTIRLFEIMRLIRRIQNKIRGL